MSIYTRTGDHGETSLFGGKRVKKNNSFIEALGSLDELNSHLGRIVSLEKNAKWEKFILSIQQDIQDINGFVSGGNKSIFLDQHIQDMEKDIDDMEKHLPELHKFILPGGSVLSSEIHITRSVCRRAERDVVKLDDKKYDAVLTFLNRLSDFLFTLARIENMKNKKE